MHTVIIRAFTKDGYHKDLVRMDEEQVRMHHEGIKDPDIESMLDTHGGTGVSVDPREFPEMVRFEVLIVRSHNR